MQVTFNVTPSQNSKKEVKVKARIHIPGLKDPTRNLDFERKRQQVDILAFTFTIPPSAEFASELQLSAQTYQDSFPTLFFHWFFGSAETEWTALYRRVYIADFT